MKKCLKKFPKGKSDEILSLEKVTSLLKGMRILRIFCKKYWKIETIYCRANLPYSDIFDGLKRMFQHLCFNPPAPNFGIWAQFVSDEMRGPSP